MASINRSCDFCREERLEEAWVKKEGPAYAKRRARWVKAHVKSELVFEERAVFSSTDDYSSATADQNEDGEFKGVSGQVYEDLPIRSK